MTLRLVFAGSSAFALAALRRLVAERPGEIAAVITQPDRPRGRSLRVTECEVRRFAHETGLPTPAPEDINAPESVAALQELRPDLGIVIAYGQILRKAVRTVPRLGWINIHASLLPRYRGAAPVQWAIANGETVSGVTSMHVEARMDAGDIILQRELPIRDDDTAGSYLERLAPLGAETLLETVRALEDGTAPRRAQDEALATLAPKLSREDGRLRWDLPAQALGNRVRGFSPWPGAFTFVPAEPPRRLRVLRAAARPGTAMPGCVAGAGAAGPLVGTAAGLLELLEVQPEGSRPMDGASALRGRHLRVGDVLA